MPHLIFWWKPHCATNRRQIAWLRQAGCQVVVRDLLAEPWQVAHLRGFFGTRPLAEWFNPAAPQMRDGRIDLATLAGLGEARVLAQLIAEPLLIRRPLIEFDGRCHCGFDVDWLAAQGIALPAEAAHTQGCSQPHAHAGGTECRHEAASPCAAPATSATSARPHPYVDPAAYCAPPSGAHLP